VNYIKGRDTERGSIRKISRNHWLCKEPFFSGWRKGGKN